MLANIFFKKYFFSIGVFTTIIFALSLGGYTTMAEKGMEAKESKIDFIYAYGDEDSTIFRIIITKRAERARIEYMACPLQQELFRDSRWEYKEGEIPIEQMEKIFQEVSISQLNSFKNLYTWEGSTAHHPALLRVYFLLGDNSEFKKEIRIENYPLGVKESPQFLKEILEITKLLQDQIVYASEKLYGEKGKAKLKDNIVEINTTTDRELKYFSSLALSLIQKE